MMRRCDMTDDLDRELRTHLDLEAEEQRDAGLAPDEARYAALWAIGGRNWSLTGSGEPAQVDGEAVSAALFPLLQADAALGRVFTTDEDRPGGARVVLLSHGLWRERFGGDAAIIGKTIRLNEEPY